MSKRDNNALKILSWGLRLLKKEKESNPEKFIGGMPEAYVNLFDKLRSEFENESLYHKYIDSLAREKVLEQEVKELNKTAKSLEATVKRQYDEIKDQRKYIEICEKYYIPVENKFKRTGVSNLDVGETKVYIIKKKKK